MPCYEMPQRKRNTHSVYGSLSNSIFNKQLIEPKSFSSMGFPGDSVVKNPPANAGDLGSTPGLGRSPGKGNGNPSRILAWKSHGQRSLAGFSPWGHKELSTKQQ